MRTINYIVVKNSADLYHEALLRMLHQVEVRQSGARQLNDLKLLYQLLEDLRQASRPAPTQVPSLNPLA